MAAVKRGDAAGLAALYTENGQVLPPNGDKVATLRGFGAEIAEGDLRDRA
jgi:hypothetical protein